MSLSLFQLAVNASAVQVAYPPLSLPDVSNCKDYYANPSPPLLSDCQIAFKNLPSGTAPTAWYTQPAAGEERNVLPLEVYHGTCDIIFHTSGQSAQSQDPVWIVPNDIKAMAAWVLARCVSGGKGGMVTKGLENTIDPITNSDSKIFPDPALPPSSTFYSLHVWNHTPSDIDWNPGNSDPDVGDALAQTLHRAGRAAPAGSPAEAELERREEYLWAAVGRTEYGEPVTNWWDGPSKPGLSSSAR